MKRIVCTAAIAATLVFNTHAAPEPWGQGFDGWSFTQDDIYGGTFCTATRGNVQLEYSTTDRAIVRHRVSGIPIDTYPEAFLGWGPATEMDTSEMAEGSYFDGQLSFVISKPTLERIANAGYFEWGIGVGGSTRRGTAPFTSGSEAFATIMDCIAAHSGGGAAPPAQAQEDPFPEEPFGEGFDGWQFTQKASVMGGAICRARLGNVSMVRLTDGDDWLGIDGAGVSHGYRKDATVKIGGASATVHSISNGPDQELTFTVTTAQLEQAAVNRGYSWSVAGKSGTVQFAESAVSALERLEECVAANRQ